MVKDIVGDLQKLKDPKRAKILARFFKTGKGEYGEGTVFWGITVPDVRSVAKKHLDIPLSIINRLLSSRIYEHRLTALIILVEKYRKAKESDKKKIVNFYLSNTKRVNSWGLVDLTADKILGNYLLKKDKSILYRLARSKNLWERRIATISTFEFIKNNKFTDSLKIAQLLLRDEHDLIHKAVGWMLREIGKRDQRTEERFLKKHYNSMPRTMLRYAIERFNERKRRLYLRR
ncbi:DNA alkylation repair protein [Candidatus Woesebacteria bacterium]|nr:DNA alkylation repair protein [Candidatus Woesebacteria bacterium]